MKAVRLLRPNDRAHLALMLASALLILLSLIEDHGHGLRVATVCAGVAVVLLATVRLIWQRERAVAPVLITARDATPA